MSESVNPTAVHILYTNHKGETAWRTVVPRAWDAVHFGSTKFHPEPQWLLEAWDVDKDTWRTFAVKDIHQWLPATGKRPELTPGSTTTEHPEEVKK